MTEIERIAAWAAGLRRDDLPPTVVERAQLQRAAVLAAAHAGEEAARAIAAVAPGGALGEVYAGAAASIAHDWDDYLYMGHTGHSAVWASRAFTADAERALVAQVAANEVAGRLGASLFLGPHNGQFWSAIHCAGAASGAGLATGLDAERLAHALAIALYQPPFGLWPGFMGPPTKLLTAAEPALQGARAALLAAEGLDGPLEVIEHPRGLLRHFAYVPRPAMLGALGDVWLTETLAFKPRPGCAYVQTAVDAALRAGVAAADVAAVEADDLPRPRAGQVALRLGARGRWGGARRVRPAGRGAARGGGRARARGWPRAGRRLRLKRILQRVRAAPSDHMGRASPPRHARRRVDLRRLATRCGRGRLQRRNGRTRRLDRRRRWHGPTLDPAQARAQPHRAGSHQRYAPARSRLRATRHPGHLPPPVCRGRPRRGSRLAPAGGDREARVRPGPLDGARRAVGPQLRALLRRPDADLHRGELRESMGPLRRRR